eukprot:Clim_evm10s217 gene=Clim_evmTU10s217
MEHFWTIPSAEEQASPSKKPHHLEERLRERKRDSYRTLYGAESRRERHIEARRASARKTVRRVEKAAARRNHEELQERKQLESDMERKQLRASGIRREKIVKLELENMMRAQRADSMQKRFEDEEAAKQMRIESPARRIRQSISDDASTESDGTVGTGSDPITSFCEANVMVRLMDVDNFEELTELMRSESIIQLTQQLFARFSEASHIKFKPHLAARTFLSSFVITQYPDHIFSVAGEDEEIVKELAAKAIMRLRSYLSEFTEGSVMEDAALKDFFAAWKKFSDKFRQWKMKDAKRLTEGLFEYYAELQRLKRRVCAHPDERNVWLPQIKGQESMLERQIRQLRGAKGMQELKAHLEDLSLANVEEETAEKARERLEEFELVVSQQAEKEVDTDSELNVADMSFEDNSASADELRKVAKAASEEKGERPEPLSETSINGVPQEILSNERMAHELAINPSFRMNTPRESTRKSGSGSEGELRANVMDQMKKAFWDSLREAVQEGKAAERLTPMVAEMRDQLIAGGAPATHNFIEALDVESIKQQLEQEVITPLEVLQHVVKAMAEFCAPARDAEINRLKSLDNEVDLAQGIYDGLAAMHTDIVNFRLMQARPMVKLHAIKYETEKFEKRYGDAKTASLPSTKAWIEKSVEEYKAKNPNAGQPKKSDIVDWAFVSMLRTSLGWKESDVPETMKMDTQRIIGMAGELRLLSFVQAIEVLLKTHIRALALDQTMLAKVHDRLMVLLRSDDSQLEHILDDIEAIYKEHTNGTDSSVLRGMCERVFFGNDKMFEIIASRIQQAFAESLRKGEIKDELVKKHNLTLVADDLNQLVKSASGLADHNTKVHAEWYDEIIAQVL